MDEHRAENTPPRKIIPPSSRNGVSLTEYAWQPGGKSPNPGGAPKGTRISTWLARFGEMDPTEWPDPSKKDLPANARIALAQLRRAMDEAEGVRAAAWAADRTEGPVGQSAGLGLLGGGDAAKLLVEAVARALLGAASAGVIPPYAIEAETSGEIEEPL